jgi:hypothetical protein
VRAKVVANEHGAARYVPWGVTGLFVTLAITYLIATRDDATAPQAGGSDAAPTSETRAPATPNPSGAPDISSMSPRERADRLYDRIMRYSEEGKTDSLTFFAPMAMTTFQSLGKELDLDARYDYGRVASETGHLDVARAEADTILVQVPTHLLGLALKARTAVKRGDVRTAKIAWAAFLAVREAEVAKKLPEYQAHANDIATATELARKQR